jgi:hypothetical protein
MMHDALCRALLASTLVSFHTGWQQDKGYTRQLLQRLLKDLESAAGSDSSLKLSSGGPSHQGRQDGKRDVEEGVSLRFARNVLAIATGGGPGVLEDVTGTMWS